MSVQYLGDFSEDQAVYIPFNTFTSDDPSESCTITNLVDTDVHIHKDGHVDQHSADAASDVSINFDGITGNHLCKINTDSNVFFATGSDYMVRIEGTTVDGATINAWIGSFSIENRHKLTAADVNTEVLDVINTDTFAEPGTGAPPATASIEEKISWLYAFWRNKSLTTAVLLTMRNDADDADICKSTLSDDATTFTKEEFVSG